MQKVVNIIVLSAVGALVFAFLTPSSWLLRQWLSPWIGK